MEGKVGLCRGLHALKLNLYLLLGFFELPLELLGSGNSCGRYEVDENKYGYRSAGYGRCDNGDEALRKSISRDQNDAKNHGCQREESTDKRDAAENQQDPRGFLNRLD